MRRLPFIIVLTLALLGIILPGEALRAQMPPGMAIRKEGGKKPLAYVSGTVYLSPEDPTESEEPGVGVAVTVIGKRASTARLDTLYAQTGPDGRFVVMGLAPGEVFIRFSMLGYEEQSRAM